MVLVRSQDYELTFLEAFKFYHTSLKYSAWCFPHSLPPQASHYHLAFLLNTWTLNTNVTIQYASLSLTSFTFVYVSVASPLWLVLDSDPLRGCGELVLWGHWCVQC